MTKRGVCNNHLGGYYINLSVADVKQSLSGLIDETSQLDKQIRPQVNLRPGDTRIMGPCADCEANQSQIPSPNAATDSMEMRQTICPEKQSFPPRERATGDGVGLITRLLLYQGEIWLLIFY